MSIIAYPNIVTASRIAVEGGYLVTYLVRNSNLDYVFTLLTNKVGYIYKPGVSPLVDIRKRLVSFSFFTSNKDDASSDLAGMGYGVISYFSNEGHTLKCYLSSISGNKFTVSYIFNAFKGEWAGGKDVKIASSLFTVFEPS